MKHLAELLQLPLALIVTAIFFACSPMPEKTQQNDLLGTVDEVVHKKAGTDALVLSRESDSTLADDGLKDSLMVLFRQQNKRLHEIFQQLNLLAKKNNTDSSKDTVGLAETFANRSDISNKTLLGKMRDQNQRLNDVVEELKLLSQNQQNQSENNYHSVQDASVVPVQPTPSQQVPVLVTGANAVTVHPIPSQQVSVSRKSNTSLNYRKAIQLYQSRQYEKAIDVFEKLLNQKIELRLADRYHFWMGVCYHNLNKSNQAINEFTKVLGYTHSEKAEGACFMIGQCYERKRAKQDAKIAFEKMLRIYPQGSLKQMAEKKLALLK